MSTSGSPSSDHIDEASSSKALRKKRRSSFVNQRIAYSNGFMNEPVTINTEECKESKECDVSQSKAESLDSYTRYFEEHINKMKAESLKWDKLLLKSETELQTSKQLSYEAFAENVTPNVVIQNYDEILEDTWKKVCRAKLQYEEIDHYVDRLNNKHESLKRSVLMANTKFGNLQFADVVSPRTYLSN